MELSASDDEPGTGIICDVIPNGHEEKHSDCCAERLGPLGVVGHRSHRESTLSDANRYVSEYGKSCAAARREVFGERADENELDLSPVLCAD